MKINTQIVADSINQQGNRITSMLVTFPRFILAELNTHRMLSKNSASSRAIPFKKMVESVTNNPFIPIAWQKEHSGMQGTEYLDKQYSFECEQQWLNARDFALQQANILSGYQATKQLANRLLEPFMWHTVLITGTEWENFFALRCPQYHSPVDTRFRHRSRKDCIAAHSNPQNLDLMAGFTDVDWLKINEGQAEIHMMALAEAMWDAMNESTPKELKVGEWHVPFGDKIMLTKMLNYPGNYIMNRVKVSTAMAARTSYTVVGDEKEFSYEKQIELHDRMANQVPFHASPFEHCARAMTDEEYKWWRRGHMESDKNHELSQGWCRNFRGFIQYREILEQNK